MAEHSLTHLDEKGNPRMVDVGQKPTSARRAVAEGVIRMSADTIRAVSEGTVPKGSVITVAELAGVMGAKRTADLIPLCHPLAVTSIRVEVTVDETVPGMRARAEVRVDGRTGVEMEALTAVSCTLLTIYDMCKALDRTMELGRIRLLHKEGGRSGTWTAESEGLDE
ncbi:MAG: cyclic pyranopterin monophosphate synthase MoaC [Gemmatimonadetes bacterium]|nr:cyclic pyranopterin monophosphate synthase MoaC [Gemmatimonadota bacterium]